MQDSEQIFQTLLKALHVRRNADARGVGAVEVAELASLTGVPAKLAAVAVADLAQRGLVEGDGNLMGFVRLSDAGVKHVTATQADAPKQQA
jgi:hypothetical protein